MKSDVIIISNDGSGMDEALGQADLVGAYKKLSAKGMLHLRLLTEETLSMMRSIAGNVKAQFWIEDEDKNFQIHLRTQTFVDFEKRDKLLSISTSGKNESARGIMGKIRTFFDPLDGMSVPFYIGSDNKHSEMSWTLSGYQETVRLMVEQKQLGADQDWDELERSVVSHLADDVKVSIRGKEVEMIILKK